MNNKEKVCLVSCSVLKQELLQLVDEGKLNAELVFVSKYFHVDYEAVEKNLRKVLETTLKRFHGKVVLIYGDLCLGPNGEMKQLSKEYGIAKVDAANCIDCQLGGKGKADEADPEHNLMLMGPGMIDFFNHMKQQLLKEGMDQATFLAMFNSIKGFILLDTCGYSEKMRQELEKANLGVPILETRKIGLDNLKKVVLKAIGNATVTKCSF